MLPGISPGHPFCFALDPPVVQDLGYSSISSETTLLEGIEVNEADNKELYAQRNILAISGAANI